VGNDTTIVWTRMSPRWFCRILAGLRQESFEFLMAMMGLLDAFMRPGMFDSARLISVVR
jgi:hypothetical protein